MTVSICQVEWWYDSVSLCQVEGSYYSPSMSGWKIIRLYLSADWRITRLSIYMSGWRVIDCICMSVAGSYDCICMSGCRVIRICICMSGWRIMRLFVYMSSWGNVTKEGNQDVRVWRRCTPKMNIGLPCHLGIFHPEFYVFLICGFRKTAIFLFVYAVVPFTFYFHIEFPCFFNTCISVSLKAVSMDHVIGNRDTHELLCIQVA